MPGLALHSNNNLTIWAELPHSLRDQYLPCVRQHILHCLWNQEMSLQSPGTLPHLTDLFIMERSITVGCQLLNKRGGTSSAGCMTHRLQVCHMLDEAELVRR